MRYKKISRSSNQSWGLLFGVVVSITVISLLVLILMGMGITGFVVVNPIPPTSVNLTLTDSSYPTQSSVLGTFSAQFDGPVDQQTDYYATLNNERYSLRLTQALTNQNISYLISSTAPEVESTASSTTLLFPGRSTQHFTLRLPRSVTIQNLNLNIHGLEEQGSYPSFLKMDANRDGQFEWEYLGIFADFNETFTLPVGLQEQQENSADITEQPAYYCELMDLPRGKDFLVSAKYLPLQSSSAADLEIALFSVSGSGSTLTGVGGTDVCDLEEFTASTAEYRDCHLTLDYPVQGNHLVCVHNAGLNLPAATYYELSRDGDQNSGYRCGAISNGRATCASQQGDFFIKLQNGIYDGELSRQVSLLEGGPETLLRQKLNEQLRTCTAYGNFCYLTLDFMSETQGAIYLDNLDITYSDQGTLVHERNFYTLSSSTGALTHLAGVDLTTSNYTLTLPLELLDILTPNLTATQTSRNYTLTVGLTPGPSTSTSLTVTSSNATTTSYTGNFTQDIVFYQELFTDLLAEHELLLTVGGFKTKIESTLQSLSRYVSLSTSTSNTTNTSLAQLEDEIMDSLDSLPQYVASVGSVSFTPSASTSDFKDEYIYPSQKTDANKQRLAYLQQQYAPEITATAVEVVDFTKHSTLFTVVQHSTSALSGAGKMITIFPASFASSLSAVSFTEDPTTTLSTSPLTVSWNAADLPATMTYVVKGNLLSASEDLRVLFVPETIPQQTEQPRTTCGDGVCSVLVSDGQKIALEDSDSCPADCGGTGDVPWTWIIVFLVIAIVAYYYFGGMYKGPGNFQEVLQRMKKSRSTTSSPKLFTSSNDETNLRTYVQNALKKGATKEAITSTLLSRGWTKQQVDAIVKQVKP
ncbi:hypothetical protein J4208_01450 [Candidatus Woesearchaeota archaeon]|nr:hypothetical protein [Candidatus Woesearchaeota archaeon]